MKPFSKKFIKAEIPERPRFFYDREPYDRADERGQKEVSKYDEEYTFLVRLIQTIGQVAPEAGQEMKDISNAYPFVTIDDVGDLATKIWTLATTKYNIPADWLTKQLEKSASLKIGAKGYRPPFEELLRMITDGYIQDDWAYEPGEINNGMCENFAAQVRKIYPEAKVISIRMGSPNGNFHVVLKYNGKFYDSEAPDGVSDLRDLQFALQFPKNTPIYTDNPNGFKASLKQASEDSLNELMNTIEDPQEDFTRNKTQHRCGPSQKLKVKPEIDKDKKADLWPAQEAAEDMVNHAPGYLSYEYGQDKTADGEFTGAEFSTDDCGVNPTLDSGPWSSPEDHGAKPQKSPFPNTGWLPADDENLDEQPASNVASSLKRPFSKKANPNTRYWIAPDGTEFPVAGVHGSWIKLNPEILKNYGIDSSDKYAYEEMFNQGWTRISNEPAGSGFQIQVKDLFNVPGYLDDFIAKHFAPGDKILIAGSHGSGIEIDDPFPTIQKAIGKATRVHASLKQATIDSQFVNQMLQSIHSNGGATYNPFKGDLNGTPNFSVSIYPDREQIVEGVDFDVLEGYVEANEDLLSDAKNSVGAWSNNGKVVLDVVVTVPDQAQAIDLARLHNQLAIWDLQNGKEILTSENDVNKTAEEQVLPQDQQDQIAAVTSPIYNTALNNYAQAVKRGHEKDRALEYAIQSVANIEKLDPKKLVELINQYL